MKHSDAFGHYQTPTPEGYAQTPAERAQEVNQVTQYDLESPNVTIDWTRKSGIIKTFDLSLAEAGTAQERA